MPAPMGLPSHAHLCWAKNSNGMNEWDTHINGFRALRPQLLLRTNHNESYSNGKKSEYSQKKAKQNCILTKNKRSPE